MILSAAAQCDGGAILPLPKSLKINKSAAARTTKSLTNRSLITEQPATRDDEAWRKAEDGGRLKLVITRMLRLSFLAPDITRAILHGRQPADLNAHKMMADTRAPIDWHEQRAGLGFI